MRLLALGMGEIHENNFEEHEQVEARHAQSSLMCLDATVLQCDSRMIDIGVGQMLGLHDQVGFQQSHMQGSCPLEILILLLMIVSKLLDLLSLRIHLCSQSNLKQRHLK